jgi:hypothetical protein
VQATGRIIRGVGVRLMVEATVLSPLTSRQDLGPKHPSVQLAAWGSSLGAKLSGRGALPPQPHIISWLGN